MTYSDTMNSLYNLSDTELRSLNRTVCDLLKSRRLAASSAAAASGKFRVGDKVSFEGRGGLRNYGTITKVKRIKVLVDTGEWQKWNVPMNMLRKEV